MPKAANHKTFVKMCGLHCAQDVANANSVKPDYVGFIVDYPKSKRNLSFEEVRTLSAELSSDVVAVGVFVNASVEKVAQLLNEGVVACAQLHGSEDENYIAQLRKLAPAAEIWKAFRVISPPDVMLAAASSADKLLLDSGAGSGKVFDWNLLEGFPRPYFLAGGLGAHNLLDALRALCPYGVDMSGGLETKGTKDLGKMREIMRIVREFDGAYAEKKK